MTSLTTYQRYGLTRVINAAGTFTPLGVSRSSPGVAAAVAEALQNFYVIDELQAAASRALADASGAEAAVVTHCVAAAITLAVAAAMSGNDAVKAASLPDSSDMPNRIVIPAGHAVDYGHPIVTDIRLAGATPVLAGDARSCDMAQLDAALAHPGTAALLLVSSRLVHGVGPDLKAAVTAAQRRGVPAIIDGAAQDLRLRDLLTTGADAVLVSAHKYLASPTAGLIVGRATFVAACRAQERGIGRAMKASKEALLGVLAAIDERQQIDMDVWRAAQQRKVARLLTKLDGAPGLQASAVPDSAGMPFSRVRVRVALPGRSAPNAAATVVASLAARTPSIRVMQHEIAEGNLVLELVPLDDAECELIAERLIAAF